MHPQSSTYSLAQTEGKRFSLLLYKVKILINLPNKHRRGKSVAIHLNGSEGNHLCLDRCFFRQSEDAVHPQNEVGSKEEISKSPGDRREAACISSGCASWYSFHYFI